MRDGRGGVEALGEVATGGVAVEQEVRLREREGVRFAHVAFDAGHALGDQVTDEALAGGFRVAERATARRDVRLRDRAGEKPQGAVDPRVVRAVVAAPAHVAREGLGGSREGLPTIEYGLEALRPERRRRARERSLQLAVAFRPPVLRLVEQERPPVRLCGKRAVHERPRVRDGVPVEPAREREAELFPAERLVLPKVRVRRDLAHGASRRAVLGGDLRRHDERIDRVPALCHPDRHAAHKEEEIDGIARLGERVRDGRGDLRVEVGLGDLLAGRDVEDEDVLLGHGPLGRVVPREVDGGGVGAGRDDEHAPSLAGGGREEGDGGQDHAFRVRVNPALP